MSASAPARDCAGCPGGPVLEESYGSLIRLLGWGHSALDEPLIGPRKTLQGPVVLLPADGYFHWLLECLPAALHSLAVEPRATVLVPRTAPRYLDDALELLGITAVHRSDAPVMADHLVLAARSPFSGFVPREDVEALRTAFLRDGEREGEEALYVSRGLDARSPANERELEAALRSVGFRIVTAQNLSLREQVDLFAHANVVAGAHGAGLSNVVWTTRPTVIEIFVAGHFNDCYARLAMSLNGTYEAFFCSSDPAPWGNAPLDEILAAANAATSSLPPGLDNAPRRIGNG